MDIAIGIEAVMRIAEDIITGMIGMSMTDGSHGNHSMPEPPSWGLFLGIPHRTGLLYLEAAPSWGAREGQVFKDFSWGVQFRVYSVRRPSPFNRWIWVAPARR